jgi:hypothetical protein
MTGRVKSGPARVGLDLVPKQFRQELIPADCFRQVAASSGRSVASVPHDFWRGK